MISYIGCDSYCGAGDLISGAQPDRAILFDNNNPSPRDQSNLRRFIPEVVRHVRVSDQLRRGESVYPPAPRAHAQDFRNALLDALANSESAAVKEMLGDLAEEPALAPHRELILHKTERRRTWFADFEPRGEEDVRLFAKEYEVTP